MNTDISVIINRFMLHTNDAILALCLNNRSFHQDQKGCYDSTEENTQNIYQQLEEQLQNCQTQLEQKFTESEAKQVASIIAIHADEAILTSGLYSNGYLWPKLQKMYIGNEDGGHVFFQYSDNILTTDQDETPKVIYEALHYCLDNGFKGRHYSNQQALNYYSKHLSDRVNGESGGKTREKTRAIYEYA